jgi:hypothetical protein
MRVGQVPNAKGARAAPTTANKAPYLTSKLASAGKQAVWAAPFRGTEITAIIAASQLVPANMVPLSMLRLARAIAQQHQVLLKACSAKN